MTFEAKLLLEAREAEPQDRKKKKAERAKRAIAQMMLFAVD